MLMGVGQIAIHGIESELGMCRFKIACLHFRRVERQKIKRQVMVKEL